MRDLIPEFDAPFYVFLSTPFMVLVFVGVLWWVYKKDRKKIYEDISKLPLDKENKD